MLNKENILIILLYLILSVSSIYNLGILSSILYIGILFLILFQKRRTSFVVLIMLLYVPQLGINIPNLYLTTTILIGLRYVKYLIKGTNIKFIKKFMIVYGIYILWNLISILFISNFVLFNQYFTIIITGFVYTFIYSSLIDGKEDIKYICKWWGIIGALTVIIGYLHFYFNDIAYITQISIEESIKNKISYDSGWVRWLWVGVEPNFFGLTLIIPLAYNLYELTKNRNVTNILLSIMCFLAILGTYSRSSFLCAMMVVILSLIKTKYFFQSMIIIIFSGICLYLLAPNFVERINTISNNIENEGGSGRIVRFKEAEKNFSENPFLGIGTGQTRDKTFTKNDTHNTYLQKLAENGIIGFIIFIILLYIPLRQAFKIRDKNHFFMIALIGVLLNMNTISMFDLRVVAILVILLYYYSNNIYPKETTNKLTSNENFIRNIS